MSGTTYEITLIVYSDCNSGTPFDGTGAPGLPDARLFVYSGNQYVDSILMGVPDITSIEPPQNNPCLTNTAGVCLQQGVYSAVYTFPSDAVNYTIEYVRCCRNGSISNLFDPIDQGATYSAIIPRSDRIKNSSPVFKQFPPIFICVNAPLKFDHSATDADGDSLVYGLCTPSQGGSSAKPFPSFPGSSFPTIMWAPGYGPNNPLGNNSLAIDAQTGMLTGHPVSQGQFVVGVCVSEYRNGALIGTYLRDFQFNVTDCNIPLAHIPSKNVNPVTGIGTFQVQCDNYSVTFRNTSYNPPPDTIPLQYQWDFGVPGITTDVSKDATPTYTYPDTGTYQVRLVVYKDNGGGLCSDTTYAFVKVYPAFHAGFTTRNICVDTAAAFLDATTSSLSSANRWHWNFGDHDTSNLTNTSHLFAAPGTYTITLTAYNELGCVDSIKKDITIYPLPATTFAYNPPCEKVPVTFALNSLTGVANFNWSFGGLGGSTKSYPQVTFPAAGDYNVQLNLTSVNGCKNAKSQTITIHPTPPVTVSADTLICAYTSVHLSATGGVEYLWSPSTGLDDTASATPLATPPPPNPFTYHVKVTDQFQCSNSDSVKISFHPVTVVDAGVDTSVCLNPGSFRDSVQLHAIGGGIYFWTPITGLNNPNVGDPVSRPPGNTTYTVHITDQFGCKFTDSVRVYYLDPTLNLILQDAMSICQRDTAYPTIVDQGASSYTWRPSFNTVGQGISTGLFPLDTTIYTLTISNYCYTKSDDVEIDVKPVPYLDLIHLDSVCTGDSLHLLAHNAQTYVWDANPTLTATNIANPVAAPVADSTKYFVLGTNALGCVSRDSELVLVFAPSPVTASPKNILFICQGQTIRLSVNGAYTYLWSPALSLDTATLANPLARPMDTTTYTVEATNIHGCKSYDSLTINVQLPVTAVALSPYDTCRGFALKLSATGGFYYRWTPGDGINDVRSDSPYVYIDSTTTYIVNVSNDCFSDTAAVEVIIHQLPEVDAGTDTTIWRDTYATLSGTTATTNHFWNPSTWLDDPNLLTTNAQPPKTSWYELWAVDDFGCKNKDSVLVQVVPHTVLQLPSGFSPNNDGQNDFFHVLRFLNIEVFNLSVYNRWGNRVYFTNNIEQGWDGTDHGSPSPEGVYIWIVTATTKDGEPVTKSGNITLVR